MKNITTLDLIVRVALLLMILLFGSVISLCAQHYGRTVPRLYISVEGGTGTRPFRLKSNIDAINNLSVDQEGFNFGVMIGGETVQAHINKGLYRSSQTVGQKIDLNETGFSLDAYPLRILHRKAKYFKPYFTSGIARSSVTFTGSYVLPRQVSPVNEEPHCPGSSEGLPADPGNPIDTPSSGPLADPDDPTGGEQPTETKELGTIHNVRASLGAGVFVMLPYQKYFISMRAEAGYGISLRQTPTVLEFAKTSISNAVMLNVGIGFGLRSR